MIIASWIIANPVVDGGGNTDGDIYILLTDSVTGLPVNGDNCTVYYYTTEDGIPGVVEHSVIIPGQSILISSGRVANFYGPPYTFGISIVRVDESTVTSPSYCDADLINIEINQQESAPGADDAIITINATSSFAPITYSLDGITYQSSSTFTGLSGGAKTAFIKDANNCEDTLDFFIPISADVFISGPEYEVSPGNVSRWNAAFCPIVFTYQRRDFGINSITENAGYIDADINADMSTISEGDLIYIKATGYDATGRVLSKTGNVVQIDIPYIADQTDGFANINLLRKNYRILTRITYTDPDTAIEKTIVSTNTPDSTGLVKADISTFLQTILRTKDESTFTELNYRDNNLSASYTVEYAAVWNGQSAEYTAITDPYYITFTGSKLGQQQGRNMNQYVPFPTVPSSSLLAKWVTDFERPSYSNGFPFDIGFIYSENITGLQIKASLQTLDINGDPIGEAVDYFLLNDDESFIINVDTSKYIISRGAILDEDLPEKIGLNRLLIYQDFADNVYSLKLFLYYMDGDTVVKITEDKYIDIEKACDTPMYMRWIGLNGCWDYWKFTWNQDVQLDVQNATIIKDFVSNWVTQTNIEKVISKSASEKVVVYADSVPVGKIQGIQAIKYSPEVQLLVNLNPPIFHTVVLNTATFMEYSTHWNAANLSVTFNKPSINIQNQ